MKGLFKRNLVKNFNKYVAINRSLVGDLVSLGIPHDKIMYIPNGVNLTEYSPVSHREKIQLRKKLRIPLQKKVFIFTGRLVKEKGIDTLIRAYKLVESYKTHLLIVGGVNEDSSLEKDFISKDFNKKAWATDVEEAYKKAKALGIASITFTWSVDDVVDYLRLSDIFVLPSFTEGFSNSLLEAMSVGLPSIVSKIPSNINIVRDDYNGLLFEVGDEKDLYKKMSYLIRNKALSLKYGKNARQYVKSNFDISLTGESYMELFN